MTCRNHRIVILMSLGEEGSRFFSIQNHLCKAPLKKMGGASHWIRDYISLPYPVNN